MTLPNQLLTHDNNCPLGTVVGAKDEGRILFQLLLVLSIEKKNRLIESTRVIFK